MVDLKKINSRVKEIKAVNDARKEDPHGALGHVGEYYGLRNLLDEVKEELNSQVAQIVYGYEDPHVPSGFTKEVVRERFRSMVGNAEHYGLEDMRIENRDFQKIDGRDFCIEFSSKDRNLIVEERVRGKDEWSGTHYEELYSKQFNNTLDMINAYFDIVDSDYQLVKDLVNNYIECETREEVFDAYVKAMKNAGWVILVGEDFIEYTFNKQVPNGQELIFEIGDGFDEHNFDQIAHDVRYYANNFDKLEGIEKIKEIEDILNLAADITEKYAEVYNELPEQDNSHKKGLFYDAR